MLKEVLGLRNRNSGQTFPVRYAFSILEIRGQTTGSGPVSPSPGHDANGATIGAHWAVATKDQTLENEAPSTSPLSFTGKYWLATVSLKP